MSQSPASLTGQRVRLNNEILFRLQNGRHPNTSAEQWTAWRTWALLFLGGKMIPVLFWQVSNRPKESVNCPLDSRIVIYLLNPRKQQGHFSPQSQQVRVLLPNMDITDIIRSSNLLTYDPLRDASVTGSAWICTFAFTGMRWGTQNSTEGRSFRASKFASYKKYKVLPQPPFPTLKFLLQCIHYSFIKSTSDCTNEKIITVCMHMKTELTADWRYLPCFTSFQQELKV